MPDHIHAVIFLNDNAGGASPFPTLGDVICAFEFLTSCRNAGGASPSPTLTVSFFGRENFPLTHTPARMKYIKHTKRGCKKSPDRKKENNFSNNKSTSYFINKK